MRLSCRSSRDFYPRPPRGGRLKYAKKGNSGTIISIHALREEGDSAGSPCAFHAGNFYPRPPRGGRPLGRHIIADGWTYFYPRPPRGGRPSRRARQNWTGRFLSTPSARRATFRGVREGEKKHYFYPRPPRGGRPDRHPICHDSCEFLSTPSARRATWHLRPPVPRSDISIHALREEGDRQVHDFIFCQAISIHALREEGDEVIAFSYAILQEFLSTPSARRATTIVQQQGGWGKLFLSTPSARRATAKTEKNISAFVSL